MVNQKNLNLMVFFAIPFTLFLFEFLVKPLILKFHPFGISPDYFKFDLIFLIIIGIALVIWIIISSTNITGIIINRQFIRSIISWISCHKIIIPFIFGTLSVITIFISKDLFNQNLIYQYDYSFHYYFSWYFNNYLIPDFHSVFGFSNFYYAGHPIVAFYPSGIYILEYVMTLLGININTTFRIIIALSIFSYYFLPYKKLKSENESVTTMIFSMFGLLVLSYWLKFIEFGQFPYLLSAEIALYLIFDFSEKYPKYRVKFLSSNSFYWHLFLIFVISLIHFMSTVILFLYFITRILYDFLTQGKSSKLLGLELRVIFIYGFFAILANMLYFLPNFFISSQFFLNNETYIALGEVSYITAIGTIILFVCYLPFFVVFIIISGFHNDQKLNIRLKRSKIQKLLNKFDSLFNQRYSVEIFFLIILWIIMFLGIIISFFGFPIINSLGLMRLLVFVIPIMSIAIGLYFNKLVNIHIIESLNHQKREKYICYSSIIFIFIITSCYNFYDFLNPALNANSTDDSPWTNIYNRKADSYVQLDENVSLVYDWIRLHDSNNYRIGIEESGLISNYKWGGYSLATLAPSCNSSFIGGYFHLFGQYYNQIFKSTIYDGIIFTYYVNGSLSSADNTQMLQKIEERLKDLNIKYLILWSQNIIDFMDKNSIEFSYLEEFGDFHIYEYNNAINSFILSTNPTTMYENFTMNQNKISVDAINCLQNEIIQISLSYYKNWHIFLNDTEILPEETVDLIKIKIPNNGNFTIRVVWIKSIYEILGELCFIMGMGLLGIIFVIHLVRKRQISIVK